VESIFPEENPLRRASEDLSADCVPVKDLGVVQKKHPKGKERLQHHPHRRQWPHLCPGLWRRAAWMRVS